MTRTSYCRFIGSLVTDARRVKRDVLRGVARAYVGRDDRPLDHVRTEKQAEAVSDRYLTPGQALGEHCLGGAVDEGSSNPRRFAWKHTDIHVYERGPQLRIATSILTGVAPAREAAVTASRTIDRAHRSRLATNVNVESGFLWVRRKKDPDRAPGKKVAGEAASPATLSRSCHEK